MKNIINKLNRGFISALLVIVYLFAVGIAKVLKTIFTAKTEKQEDTYWRDAEREKKIDFKSPY